MTTQQRTARVPFLDLVLQHRALEEELVEAFRRALRTAAFINGPEVSAFESELASFVGTRGAVGVASGTDALRFIYQGLGVRPGDEVITTGHTFIATTESITQAGGTVRFVDIDEAPMTIDPAAVAAAVTPRTVGIVPVHLYGQSADMDPLLAVAARHRLWVVEDACQAHGASYKGRNVGTLGAAAAWSYYPGKNLGACGDAGAVTSSDETLLATVRRLREHGQSRKYLHETEGYTGRMDAIQAAFLRIKLRHLPAWIEGRRRAAAWYREALADVPEVTVPAEALYGRHVWHLYVMRGPRRDALQAHLTAHGIGTGLHYPHPLHLQPAYQHLGLSRGAFPVSERTAESLLSLPMFPELTQDQVGAVADAVRSFYRG